MGWFSFLDGVFKRRNQPSRLGEKKQDKDRLLAEQRALADEVEALFRRFDGRLQDLAMHAHRMSEEDFDRQAEVLRAAQTNLRLALRRLEASTKTTRELERELGEWEGRDDAGPLHPDHPATRAEMVRSELAVRGVSRDLTKKFLKDFVATQQMACSCEGDCHVEKASVPNASETAPRLYEFRTYEPVPQAEAEHIVQAIREATREAERWHAVPLQMHDADTLDQLRHLRDLHAILKRLDRQRGITRDRIELAVHVRETH